MLLTSPRRVRLLVGRPCEVLRWNPEPDMRMRLVETNAKPGRSIKVGAADAASPDQGGKPVPSGAPLPVSGGGLRAPSVGARVPDAGYFRSCLGIIRGASRVASIECEESEGWEDCAVTVVRGA